MKASHFTNRQTRARGMYVPIASLILFVIASCAPSERTQPSALNAPPVVNERASTQKEDEAQPQAAAPQEIMPSDSPQLLAPANEPVQPRPAELAETQRGDEAVQSTAHEEISEPTGRTAFYRADSLPAELPPVVLSKGHEALCRVKVGDAMPQLELSMIDGSRGKPLSEFFGDKATVVVFWKSNRRMAAEQLADMGPDVVGPFGGAGVAVVGIAVGESPDSAQATLQRAKAEYPNLLDADGKAFDQVGSEKLPRTYLLDSQGKIVWFDIEYSLSTRRELHQALRAIVGK
jgi:peroxiredoxin